MSENYFEGDFAARAPRNYERYFVPVIGAPLAEDLVPAAALKPGERVLDVACGTGVVARMAASRVGAEGSVSGVDLHPGMLAVARETAPPEAAITWHEGNAESLPFPDGAFDAVLCQISLMFVPEKPAALREMRRVLADGGRAVLNVPRPVAMFTQMAAAMERHIGPMAAGFVRQVFSLNDPQELDGLLKEAGFRDVAVATSRKTLSLPAPADFLWQYVSSTPLVGALAQAGEASRAALEQAVVKDWKPYTEGAGMRYEQEILTATGRK